MSDFWSTAITVLSVALFGWVSRQAGRNYERGRSLGLIEAARKRHIAAVLKTDDVLQGRDVIETCDQLYDSVRFGEYPAADGAKLLAAKVRHP